MVAGSFHRPISHANEEGGRACQPADLGSHPSSLQHTKRAHPLAPLLPPQCLAAAPGPAWHTAYAHWWQRGTHTFKTLTISTSSPGRSAVSRWSTLHAPLGASEMLMVVLTTRRTPKRRAGSSPWSIEWPFAREYALSCQNKEGGGPHGWQDLVGMFRRTESTPGTTPGQACRSAAHREPADEAVDDGHADLL